MSAPRPVVAIAAAPRADGREGTEFLRVLVALRACGREVVLLETGAGAGVLSGDPDVTVEAERYLAALREEGVLPRAASEAEVASALAGAEAVVVLPDPARAGAPAFLRLPAAPGAPPADAAGGVASVVAAGQVALG